MSIINNRKKNTGVHDSVTLRGNKRSFAVAEAHKRLRTNVLFSFSNESGCRVIGVTSSMMHEGKSTTSINLAYDMLQAGKKVLLIDADMRLSNFENTLELATTMGTGSKERIARTGFIITITTMIPISSTSLVRAV